MTPTACLRRAAGLTISGLFGLVLSGCMLISETSLIDPSEGQALFEEAFIFAPYDNGDDILPLAKDAPQGDFTYANGGYSAPDGTMTVYFLPPPDGGDYLMLAVLASDGAMYGTAHRDRAGITELRLVFAAGLADKANLLPPGVDLADGGIQITRRADLDAIIPLIANGTLPTSPLIAYVGGDTPPPTIIRDGDWYRPGE